MTGLVAVGEKSSMAELVAEGGGFSVADPLAAGGGLSRGGLAAGGSKLSMPGPAPPPEPPPPQPARTEPPQSTVAVCAPVCKNRLRDFLMTAEFLTERIDFIEGHPVVEYSSSSLNPEFGGSGNDPKGSPGNFLIRR